ncbi:MAG: signal peptidase I [Acidobacteriota bacterium]
MIGRTLSEIFRVVVATAIAALFVQTWLLKAFVVPSDSMEPTLLPGDLLLVNRFIHRSPGGLAMQRQIQRGDVILFRLPGDAEKILVKRCVGVGGDTIELRDKDLLVNGEPMLNFQAVFRDPNTYPSSRFVEQRLRDRDNFGPLTVPEGALFVLGDNRDLSYDSRFWGTVPLDSVLGSARLIYWSRDDDTQSVRWKRIGQSVR